MKRSIASTADVPVIWGTRVPTIEVLERLIAGDSGDIATDFGRTVEEVHEAIRCEHAAAA